MLTNLEERNDEVLDLVAVGGLHHNFGEVSEHRNLHEQSIIHSTMVHPLQHLYKLCSSPQTPLLKYSVSVLQY